MQPREDASCGLLEEVADSSSGKSGQMVESPDFRAVTVKLPVSFRAHAAHRDERHIEKAQ